MQLEGLTQLQVAIADHLWTLDTLDEVNEYINKLPKRQRGQARLVQAMIEIAAIDDIIADDDLDLANEAISLVK